MKGGIDSSKFVGLGLVFGIIFGAATGHIGLGIALGIVFGAAIAAGRARRDGRPRT